MLETVVPALIGSGIGAGLLGLLQTLLNQRGDKHKDDIQIRQELWQRCKDLEDQLSALQQDYIKASEVCRKEYQDLYQENLRLRGLLDD